MCQYISGTEESELPLPILANTLQALAHKKLTQLRIRHVLHLKRGDQFQALEESSAARSLAFLVISQKDVKNQFLGHYSTNII